MMREQAAGGKNLPQPVARDIAGFVEIITGILDAGAREDTFTKATPFIVHLLIIGNKRLACPR
jgi:hypothetical protein